MRVMTYPREKSKCSDVSQVFEVREGSRSNRPFAQTGSAPISSDLIGVDHLLIGLELGLEPLPNINLYSVGTLM